MTFIGISLKLKVTLKQYITLHLLRPVCLFDCRATTTSFMAVAYEYAVEMTYPLPEGTSAGLVNLSSQVHNCVHDQNYNFQMTIVHYIIDRVWKSLPRP